MENESVIYLLSACDAHKTYASSRVVAASNDFVAITDEIGKQILQGNMTFMGHGTRISSYKAFIENSDDLRIVQSCLEYGIIVVIENKKRSIVENPMIEYFATNIVYSEITVYLEQEELIRFLLSGSADEEDVFGSDEYQAFMDDDTRGIDTSIKVLVKIYKIGKGQVLDAPPEEEMDFIKDNIKELNEHYGVECIDKFSFIVN